MSHNIPHERRVGDLTKVYSAILTAKNTAGVATVKDLTGLTITFTMINAATGAVKVNAAAASIVNAVSGIVKYDFIAADINTAGIYWGSFVVTETAKTDTYPASPSEGPIWIHSATQTAQQAYAAAKAAE